MNFKYLFNKENRIVTIFSLLCFVVGVMFCVLPTVMMGAFETIMCFLFLAYGGIMMFAYCIAPVVFSNKKIMISAIISILLGALLLFVRSFFVLALAFCVLAFSIFKFLVIKKTKDEKNLIYYLWIILGIVYAVVSLLVIVFFAINKFNNVSMILIGVCFVFEAVANMFVLIRNSKMTLQSEVETINEDVQN